MPIRFPSLEFFQSLQEQMKQERDRFRQLGYFDTTFGVAVRDPSLPGGVWQCVLSFEVFECVGLKAADLSRETVDFTLDGHLNVWVEMLRNIKQHGAADTAHTINTLTHFGEGLRCVYDDPDGHDKLYRFAESVQEFFDLAAKVDVAFPEAASAAAHA
ncbi:MAG TPA: hypothetical protein VMW17_01915 [Candidatus Binatia bacterium]|nr:hypothetical protein [Candidatus Binatia bacterium]